VSGLLLSPAIANVRLHHPSVAGTCPTTGQRLRTMDRSC
jgi:hypothetical protein